MIWKVIGQSVTGVSHLQTGKTCEDAFACAESGHALVCFVSDGAGSAQYAAEASRFAVDSAVNKVTGWLEDQREIDEAALTELAEMIYDELKAIAEEKEIALNEFSCTLLGAIVLPTKACFLQIGDGAIIIDNGEGNFRHIWWPHNGEYQNTTTFLIDDPSLPNLKTKILEGSIFEVGLFTDGLQMLALDNETESVHQPFFTGLFTALRMAANLHHTDILNTRLNTYLSGEAINSRTDDDKTLVLATRLMHGSGL